MSKENVFVSCESAVNGLWMLLSHCSPTELLLRVLSVKEVPLFRKSYYFCAPGNPQFLSSLPHSIPLAIRTMLMFPTSVNAQHLRWRLFDSFFFMAFLSPLSLHKRLSPCCFRRWYWLKVSGRKSKHGNGVKMRHSKWNFRITCVVVVYLTFALLQFQFHQLYPHPNETLLGCSLLI